jgi:hypothetical protein
LGVTGFTLEEAAAVSGAPLEIGVMKVFRLKK